MSIRASLKLLFVMQVFTLNANSQSTLPIAENASWIIHHQWFDGTQPLETYILYRTGNSVSFNGTDYVSLHSMLLNRTNFSTFTQAGPEWTGYAFRNDTNNMAYLYVISDNAEYLWYDFNLSVGDTLKPPGTYSYQYQFFCGTETMVVTDIDYFNFGGSTHKRFVFNNGQTDFPWLLQNVGFTDDLLMFNCNYHFEDFYGLLFFCPDSNMAACSVIITGNENYTDRNKAIHLYPNPTSGHIHIELGEFKSEAVKILLRETTGRVVQFLIPDPGVTSINMDPEVSNGIYFLEIQSKYSSVIRQIVVLKD